MEEPDSICSESICEGFHGKHLWRAKELASAGSYSRTTSSKHKNSPFPTMGKEEGRDHKRPPWLNNELLNVLKSKKEAYWLWKSCQIPAEENKNLARACRQEAVRKVKAQLELNLAKDVKNSKKSFFRYMSIKQKYREDIGPLLNRTGKTPTGDAEKEEFLNTFSTSALCLYRCRWTPNIKQY